MRLSLLCNIFLLTLFLPYSIQAQISIDLDDNENFAGFTLLEDVLDDNIAYINGEDHRYRESNNKIQYKMFKYLHQNAGVNTMMLEFGFSRGYIIDKWVQTGDSMYYEILKLYSFSIDIPMFEKLRNYRKNLEEADSFRIVGIDLDREYPIAIKAMAILLPDHAPPEPISLSIEALRGMAEYLDFLWESYYENNLNFSLGAADEFYDTENFVDSMIVDFNRNREIYYEYLGEEFAVFEKIIKGTERSRIWNEYEKNDLPHAYTIRERYMYQRFKEEVFTHPNSKFFGQFGRCHIAFVDQREACGWFNYNSVVNLINSDNDPRLKDKVVSIATFYPTDRKDFIDVRGMDMIEDFREKSDKDLPTLYRLKKDEEIIYSKQEHISDYYDFVMINPSRLASEQVDEITNIIYNDYQDPPKSVFSFNYRQRYLDYGELNMALDGLGIGNLNGLNHFGGIEWSIISSDNGYFSLDYNFMIPEEIAYNDTSLIKQNSHSYFIRIGYAMINADAIQSILSIGMGFGNIKITNLSNFNGTPGFLTQQDEHVLHNPYMLLEGKLGFLFNLGGVGLSVGGGYQYDVSRKQWIDDGKLTINGPKTSGTGLILNLGLIFVNEIDGF